MEIKYKGSANKIPSLNLKFKDGETIEVTEEIGNKLIEQNIGFTQIKYKKENKVSKILKR